MAATQDKAVEESQRIIAELRRERDAALEREAALTEVLDLINRSPGNPELVFETILEKAHTLCGAAIGALSTYDGTLMHTLAMRGFPDDYAARMREPWPPPEATTQRLIEGANVVHIQDSAEIERRLGLMTGRSGMRTTLVVPLRKDAAFLGQITAFRAEVRPFAEQEIALLESFAAQAVIALENARLLGELRERTEALSDRNIAFAERIDHQAATIDVLKAMSASPGDPRPVFDLIVQQATDACNGLGAALFEYDGSMVHCRSIYAPTFPPEALNAYRGLYPKAPTRDATATRAILDRQIVHIRDYSADQTLSQTTRDANGNSGMALPLMRGGTVIGAIGITSSEFGGFSDSQVDLLRTFAEQAVIAIGSAETYRALHARTAELTERDAENRALIARQEASIEILRAISTSPDDTQPVFELIVRHARELCDAQTSGVTEYDGSLMYSRVIEGLDPEATELLRQSFPRPPGSESVAGRVVLSGQIVHVSDTHAQAGYFQTGRALGTRSMLGVPLLLEGRVIGTIILGRFNPGGFDDSQIALVESFADQAVIALASARTLRELRTRTADLQESLEYQTATSDVLQVINASPGNLTPVFETILAKAHTLCGAEIGSLGVFDGQFFRKLVRHGYPREVDVFLSEPYPPLPQHAPLFRGETINAPDITTYQWGPEIEQTSMDRYARLGLRTWLEVPLWKDGTLLGTLSGWSHAAGAFSDKEIRLLQNFAAQAVIAMENARLINEQREALEQQTATVGLLRVINASPGDLTPVFDAVLKEGLRLVEAAFGTLWIVDGERSRSVVSYGLPDALVTYRADFPEETGGISLLGQDVIRTRRSRQVLDVRESDGYRAGHRGPRAVVDLGGARSLILVPLVKEATVLGFIQIYRQEVRAFTSQQIALLENFAAQAVIAMDNARLINETREALEQQTATAEVLQVINASPGNLAPVFDTMLEKAMRLCEAAFGILMTFDGERFHSVATRGVPAVYTEFRAAYPIRAIRGGPGDRAFITRRPIHVLDLKDEESYRSGDAVEKAIVDLGGARTALVVPLLKDEAGLGIIVIYRQEVRAFSGKEAALLENFAAQAVIAMENARLMNETREALEQQTATAEVLQVINASPGNLAPVFDAILQKAHKLCGATAGTLATYDGEYFRAVATFGLEAEHAERMRRRFRPNPRHQTLVDGARLLHIADIQAVELLPDDDVTRDAIERSGSRTTLAIPLRKDGTLIGFISALRKEVRPFADKEIALLENFAAQAVIAMENARLLNEIRQRQDELRATFENMGDGVAMFDETRNLVAWNRKFLAILDVPDAIVGQRLTFEDYIRYLAGRAEFGQDADAGEQVRRLLGGLGQPATFERARPDGRVIEVRQNPIPAGGFVLIYADITDRKRNEAEIAAARDAAREATRTIETAFRELKTAQANLIQAEKMASLGQLTAGIAHEIKNPLNFVNNFAILSVELLGELKESIAAALTSLTEDQRADVEETVGMLTSNLEKITEHGKRADGIVKAMLEHSRGESGERREVDINALADEALNLAYHGARAQDQSFNITLERDFGDGIAKIEVNPQDLTRVFLNLFSNGFYAANKRARNGAASEFAPTLKISTRDAGGAVEVRVRDNGTGIPEDIRNKLFQPFFTTKPSGEGTGLGLSITYDIVTKQHGGTISVSSEVDAFTEFVVTLPRGMFAAEGAPP